MLEIKVIVRHYVKARIKNDIFIAFSLLVIDIILSVSHYELFSQNNNKKLLSIFTSMKFQVYFMKIRGKT